MSHDVLEIDRLLSVAEAAVRCGVKPATVRGWLFYAQLRPDVREVKAGVLHSLFRVSTVDRWREKRQVRAPDGLGRRQRYPGSALGRLPPDGCLTQAQAARYCKTSVMRLKASREAGSLPALGQGSGCMQVWLYQKPDLDAWRQELVEQQRREQAARSRVEQARARGLEKARARSIESRAVVKRERDWQQRLAAYAGQQRCVNCQECVRRDTNTFVCQFDYWGGSRDRSGVLRVSSEFAGDCADFVWREVAL